MQIHSRFSRTVGFRVGRSRSGYPRRLALLDDRFAFFLKYRVHHFRARRGIRVFSGADVGKDELVEALQFVGRIGKRLTGFLARGVQKRAYAVFTCRPYVRVLDRLAGGKGSGDFRQSLGDRFRTVLFQRGVFDEFALLIVVRERGVVEIDRIVT